MGRRDPLAANRSAPASRAAPKAEAAKSSPASSRAGSPRGPPAVDATKLKIPDCRGPLKKTSKSRLSGRAWKKRWLRVRLDLKDGENYALTYHKKEHDDARMTLALAGCAVRELEGADGWRDFRVFDAHEAFELRATSTEERRAWIDSLRHVITVADARARWIEANASPRPKATPPRLPRAPPRIRRRRHHRLWRRRPHHQHRLPAPPPGGRRRHPTLPRPPRAKTRQPTTSRLSAWNARARGRGAGRRVAADSGPQGYAATRIFTW